MNADEQAADAGAVASAAGPDDGSASLRAAVLAGVLLLAAAALWVAATQGEARMARRAVGPDADLLSSREVEDELHV